MRGVGSSESTDPRHVSQRPVKASMVGLTQCVVLLGRVLLLGGGTTCGTIRALCGLAQARLRTSPCRWGVGVRFLFAVCVCLGVVCCCCLLCLSGCSCRELFHSFHSWWCRSICGVVRFSVASILLQSCFLIIAWLSSVCCRAIIIFLFVNDAFQSIIDSL